MFLPLIATVSISVLNSPNRQRTLGALALACAFLFAFAAVASADTYTVDTGSDNGSLNACTGAAADCSLRGALGLVNGGSGGDIVKFVPALTVVIDSPLPLIAENTAIESDTRDTLVRGSGTYTGSCGPSDWAFDLTDAEVRMTGVTVRQVCGRAIRSDIPFPTASVGQRLSNGYVNVFAATGGPADIVHLFYADPPASGAKASSYITGASSFVWASPAINAGDAFAVQTTAPNGSSGYLRFTAPADLTSPVPLNAVAVNNNTIRVDYNETLSSTTVTAATAGLSVAGLARGIVSGSVSGNSAYFVSNFPWGTGETGSITFTGNDPIADAVGNQVVGQPSLFVAAGPGELAAPTISRYKVSPRAVCVRYSSRCKRKEIAASFTLNKASRVTFEVYRGKKFVVKFIRNLDAGSNKVRMFASMNGRKLPLSKKLVLRATPQDLARTPGAQVQAHFRGVKTRKDY